MWRMPLHSKSRKCFALQACPDASMHSVRWRCFTAREEWTCGICAALTFCKQTLVKCPARHCVNSIRGSAIRNLVILHMMISANTFCMLCSTEGNEARNLKVWEREGCELHAVGTAPQGLHCVLAWQPNGRHLYAAHSIAEHHRVVLYETNGLEHGGFDVPTLGALWFLRLSHPLYCLAMLQAFQFLQCFRKCLHNICQVLAQQLPVSCYVFEHCMICSIKPCT